MGSEKHAFEQRRQRERTAISVVDQQPEFPQEKAHANMEAVGSLFLKLAFDEPLRRCCWACCLFITAVD